MRELHGQDDVVVELLTLWLEVDPDPVDVFGTT